MLYLFKKLKFEEYLIILFPLSLLSGPFLTDLTIIIIDLLYIIKIFSKKNEVTINKKYFFYTLYFFTILLFSALFSDSIQYYLIETLPLIRFIIFPFALINILSKNISNIYINLILIIFLILIIDTLIQIYFGNNILGYPYIYDRPTSFFNDEQVLGSYVVRNLSFLIPIFLLANDKLNYKFYLILFISCILITLSKERVSFFYLLIYLLIIFINFYLFNKNKKLIVLKSFSFIFLIILILYFIDGVNIKKRFDQTLVVIKNENNIYFDQEKMLSKKDKTFQNFYIFSSEHENYLLTSVKIFNSNKYFGAGVKSYRNECKKDEFKINEYSCSTHPHNTYAQLLSEIGIFGTLPIIFIFLISVYNLLRLFLEILIQNKNILFFKGIFFYLPVIISFFPIIPSGNFFNNYLASYYSFSVGIFLYYLMKEKK